MVYEKCLFRLISVDIGLRWFMSTTVNQNFFRPLFIGSTFASALADAKRKPKLNF